MYQQKKCPICKKRALDAEIGATGKVKLKCPHCHNIISIILNLTRKLKK